MKKKIKIALHWANEYNRIDCKNCKLNQCDGKFKLGIEDRYFDKNQNKIIETGFRFQINHCYQKEMNEVIEYLNFFYNYKRYGMPFSRGWLEMPKKLFEILDILEIESNYLRSKNG